MHNCFHNTLSGFVYIRLKKAWSFNFGGVIPRKINSFYITLKSLQSILAETCKQYTSAASIRTRNLTRQEKIENKTLKYSLIIDLYGMMFCSMCTYTNVLESSHSYSDDMWIERNHRKSKTVCVSTNAMKVDLFVLFSIAEVCIIQETGNQ